MSRHGSLDAGLLGLPLGGPRPLFSLVFLEFPSWQLHLPQLGWDYSENCSSAEAAPKVVLIEIVQKIAAQFRRATSKAQS